jgi:DNA polymerase-3 subunit epsilon
VIFDRTIDFDPAGDIDAFLIAAPARWAVYLMADSEDRPVQLLCVRDLRYSLKRRLSADEAEAPRSKRVDYRALVRRIHWRRVDSAFEADAIYLEAAREFFPRTYRAMMGFQPAWFVHVDADAEFPRYTRTTDLHDRPGVLIGPVQDKFVAARLVEEVADWFDLCRYYNILLETPNATACAYKEMGKCPAPCDGSISIEQYRGMMAWSARLIVEPQELIAGTKARMQQAAGELRYETASKVKAYVDSLSQLGKGPLRHLRRLEDFSFVSLQRGPREGTAKVFLISPGRIEEAVGLMAEPAGLSELLHELARERRECSVDETGAERVGLVTQHLFRAKKTHGVFLPVGAVDEKSLAKGFGDLRKQKPPAEEAGGEGVLKEMQAM